MAVTGLRHARYRGRNKTHLEHVYPAATLNLIRLNAWWNSHPLDHTRTTHLTRLQFDLLTQHQISQQDPNRSQTTQVTCR
ncbi:MAG: hypothetical protein ACRDRO_25150 [Pseudonocardiaceae bacterium]